MAGANVVYVITAPSGRQYVGWTSRSVERRWAAHVSASKRFDTALARAIRKYGSGAFIVQVIERMSTRRGATLAERLWIDRLGTRSPRGYNLTDGGEGLPNPTAEVRRRKSEAGKRVMADPVRRAQIGDFRRGRPVVHSAETRAKIGAALRGKRRPGRVVSAEGRAKLSEAARRRHARERGEL